MLRWKMNKVIRLLEKNPRDLQVLDPKYTKALTALEEHKVIEILRSWGGEIVRITLKNHYVIYQMDRRELWANRIISFILGVATTVLTAIITGVLKL